MTKYGKELIIDLHDCDTSLFNREAIAIFFKELCELIDMEACDCHFWDDFGVDIEEQQTEVHTKGTSAIQFILTSNITIHTLDLLKNVYLNIFSCKDFDSEKTLEFSASYFKGKVKACHTIERI